MEVNTSHNYHNININQPRITCKEYYSIASKNRLYGAKITQVVIHKGWVYGSSVLPTRIFNAEFKSNVYACYCQTERFFNLNSST
jgi:hypothetical protein